MSTTAWKILPRSKPYRPLARPLRAVLGAALLWANFVSKRTHRMRRGPGPAGAAKTATHAQAYGLYPIRSIAQMDYVTMQLGQSWEHAHRPALPEDIVSMAHAPGMPAVAAGVDTPAELAGLETLRCDEVRGYLLARPMPAAQMAELLLRHLDTADS